MARKRKREALVHQHLERVSRSLLERHQDIVRGIIGRNAGIYALYRRGKLYYVGLASGLSGRLKAHLRDGHKGRWDQFSIYFTIRDQHIKEIESLLLQIAEPPGNKMGGKPVGSTNLLGSMRRLIKQKQKKELSLLVGKQLVVQHRANASAEARLLIKLFPRGARLRGTIKGKNYTARIRRDGKIRFNKEIFNSLRLAVRACHGRGLNGWNFWRVERGKGNWVTLSEFRKAGTPMLSYQVS